MEFIGKQIEFLWLLASSRGRGSWVLTSQTSSTCANFTIEFESFYMVACFRLELAHLSPEQSGHYGQGKESYRSVRLELCE